MDIFELGVPEGLSIGLIAYEIFELVMIEDNILDDAIGRNGKMPQFIRPGEIIIPKNIFSLPVEHLQIFFIHHNFISDKPNLHLSYLNDS